MALCRGHDRRQAPSGTQGNHLLRPQRHHGRAGGPREGARESGERPHAGGVARRARRLRRVFGTYSVDERAGTVTHRRHASVQPGDVGDLVRGYAFEGDRLILRPPGTTYEVIWERIT